MVRNHMSRVCSSPYLDAQNSKGGQRTLFKPKPLTVPNVFSKLTEIAKVSGKAVSRFWRCTLTAILTYFPMTVAKPKGSDYYEPSSGM